MNISVSEENGRALLSLEGRLDSNTSGALEQQLTATMDSGSQQLIIDFDQLAYISSAGLRVLLMAAKRLKSEGGHLVLCGMADHIREVFEISGFLQILTVVADVSAAQASLDTVAAV